MRYSKLTYCLLAFLCLATTSCIQNELIEEYPIEQENPVQVHLTLNMPQATSTDIQAGTAGEQYFNDDNWIINQARPNGLLEQEASEIVRIQRTYTNMGVYNNDKMVASFTFGFWTYLFTRRNYRIGGKTLLQIFPNKAHGLKQTDIYKQLTAIREFRNRIAHHEPICFNATRAIDTKYAKEHYELIRTYIEYMGFDSDSVLRMVEKPDSILKVIDGMK